ncbi:MAG: radical SAM protein [Ruminococcaceae bacterium]|nr:radical SAM protein [Oscillospiraceae bacterium]
MNNNAKKHANIPIFIPHEGCPNGCVFCNQKKITGTTALARRNIVPEIEAALATIDPDVFETEIAFFGGSFTGIDRSEMKRLLECVNSFVKEGRVSSIRLSTRPDYINGEILDILSNYGVLHIELGVQSASDAVLSASKRGHTAECAKKALQMIVDRGFVAGGQMMIGLPGSTLADEIQTAKTICECGALEARIYPTVVFYDTELCNMAKRGEYIPLTTADAAKRAAKCYRIFLENGVKVLRVGLQSSENLSSENEVFAGANHPALGELCEGRVYLDLIKEDIEKKLCTNGNTLVIEAPFGETSKISGHKKENKTALLQYLCNKQKTVRNIKIVEKFDEKFRINTYFTDN